MKNRCHDIARWRGAIRGYGADGIAGANTAFDELANLAGFSEALEQDGTFVLQDGVFDFFSGDLFGSN